MPAKLRRIVTGVDAAGRSGVIEDAPASRHYELESLGGMSAGAIWEVQMPVAGLPAGGEPAAPLTLRPPAGGVRFFRFILPPDARVSADLDAIIGEVREKVPSFFEAVDPAREFGMHRTNTVDLIYVASGGADLILEDGTVSLGPGDALVQQGTWHAWSNPHDEPCVMVIAMLGAAGEDG